MTNSEVPVIKNGCLVICGRAVLKQVPENVVISTANSGSAFIGASSTALSSRHVFNLGILENYKFVCLFLVKIWWMIPRFGKSASEIPMETQMLLLDADEESMLENTDTTTARTESQNKHYVLVLPVLDGAFRTTLQGTSSNELQFCYESGDPQVQTSQALEGVFINSGDNPFELMKDSIKILAKHKGTFNHLENKKAAAHLDWFGWCTWDAFYTEVSPKGIKEGLQSFKDGGVSPRFLIIDDGWQETTNEYAKEGDPLVEGTQYTIRLTDIKENSKFTGSESDGSSENLKELVHYIKGNYGLKYVYIWHTIVGYWGGLNISSEALNKYNPKLAYAVQSPGNSSHIRDLTLENLEKYGFGLISEPQKILDFYSDMHSYLAGSGVDGVKVDGQNILAALGGGSGGRVSITKQYHQALDESVEKNFGETNLICCMSHNSDNIFRQVYLCVGKLRRSKDYSFNFLFYFYSSKKSSTARVSEDFFPNEPSFQTLHIASVSFNSLLLGEIFVPDWDMFQSNHKTAEFHGAARALGGCPVYVSDKPGKHDFDILRKLVLPDGTILRAKYAGRPTQDCLFVDPVMDGKSLLKIWNLNKVTGVRVFNCQGAGIWQMEQSPNPTNNHTTSATYISGRVSPLDVEFLDDIGGENWTGDSAVYTFNSGSLSRVPKDETIRVSLGVLQCEIFTVSPIKVFKESIGFAPIGLINMYNSGGAVEECAFYNDSIKVKARGCGLFGAYSSIEPYSCKVDKKAEPFTYSPDNRLLSFDLQSDHSGFKEIEIVYCGV